jgi:hypothetical protein
LFDGSDSREEEIILASSGRLLLISDPPKIMAAKFGSP